MKVALLTDFYVYDEAYSLIGVASTQLQMLRRSVDFVLVVDQAFPQSGTPWHAEDICLRRIPGVPRGNSIRVDTTWDKDIETLRAGIEAAVDDCDVVITHDLIFQPSLIKHHMAARKVAAGNPHIRWLHWIHSATNSFMSQYKQFVQGPFPNSTIVFPNAYDIPRVANNYEVPETSVAHVPHATDLSFVMAHPLSRTLAEQISLQDADVIGVYPARLDAGKQVEIGIEIFAGLKRMGQDVRYIVFDFHSTGQEKIAVRQRCEQIAVRQGLEVGREVVFTSTWSKETNVRCPRQMVRDFMAIGDVLILPSRSETYSLVAQEAALCKNLLVLNFDFPPMRSIYGDDALYAKFSSNIDVMNGQNGETTTKYGNRRAYMDEQAWRILSRLNESMALRQFRRVRKTRNPEAVYRDYLAPLIWRQS